MTPGPLRSLLPTLFTSLTRQHPASPSTSATSSWTLLRTLKSENPDDIQGQLRGTARFTPLRSSSSQTTRSQEQEQEQSQPQPQPQPQGSAQDLLYSEEGTLPHLQLPNMNFPAGLRWTKKYIWRLSSDGRISVWFVRVDKRPGDKDRVEEGEGEEEADYLFHEFEFSDADSTQHIYSGHDSGTSEEEEFVTAPTPPEVFGSEGRRTRVITARGNHLCVNDMYRTAYAFRVEEGSGEVVSWASRHVVRGPRKAQDIVNLYSRTP
ncbi:hypothetical protein BJX61DRAFT_546381 [Aspergillus egyptiacus]|nr:hypothetical protein BJX61DRAFT_546381 [Aspergillus egyptiacus]